MKLTEMEKSSVKKFIIGLLLLILSVVIAYDQYTRRPYPSPGTLKLPSVLSQVQLVGFKPDFDYRNAHVLADFAIVNNSRFTLTEVVLHCEYKDSFERTVYDNSVHEMGVISPHTTKAYTQQRMADISQDIRTAICSLAEPLRFY